MPKAATADSSRFDKRKQEIIDAAAQLINLNGLRDTTLAVVASGIGLNLKSLRYYFQRREELVAACFQQSIALHRQVVDQAMDAAGPEDRVRGFIAGYFDLLARIRRQEHPPFVHFGDLNALQSPHADDVIAAFVDLFRAVRALIASPATQADVATLNSRAHFLLSQLWWSPLWLAAYLPEDFPRAAERFSDILLKGIAGRPELLDSQLLPPPPPPVEREHLNQESFLRAATELINQIGYRGASPDRISSLLNVTKGSFYHHNDNREEVVLACFERTFEIIQRAQDTALRRGFDGLDCIAAIGSALVARQMTKDGILLRTSALAALSPAARGAMALRMEVYTARFASILNDGLIDGSVRPCDVHIAAEVVTAMINSAQELQRWVATADAQNAPGLYVRPLMAGLLAPPA